MATTARTASSAARLGPAGSSPVDPGTTRAITGATASRWCRSGRATTAAPKAAAPRGSTSGGRPSRSSWKAVSPVPKVGDGQDDEERERRARPGAERDQDDEGEHGLVVGFVNSSGGGSGREAVICGAGLVRGESVE